MVAAGFKTKEIAKRLGTSPSAVVTHQKRAARKLGCEGTGARAAVAAAMARRQALQEALDAVRKARTVPQAMALVRSLNTGVEL